MARKFMLQLLRGYNVKCTKKSYKRSVTFDVLCLQKTKHH
jgi:hypothetical protein